MARQGTGDLPLFLLLLATFAYFYQGGFANLNSRFDLSLALAYEHRVAIDTFQANTIDKASFRGHTYSEKAPGTAYLALPAAWIASRFLAESRLLAQPEYGDRLLYVATVLSVCWISALSAVFFRRWLARLDPDGSPVRSAALTLLVYLGTLILPYSTILFGHQLAGACLVIGGYFAFTGAEPDRSPARLAIAVSLLAVAVLIEYPAVFPAAGIALGVWLSTRPRRQLLPYLAFAVPPALLLLLYNRCAFGSPFALGYGKLQGSPFAEQMAHGFFGVGGLQPARIAQLLFGVYRGLFVYCPVLLFAVLAAPRAWRSAHRRFFVGIWAGAVALLLLNASYSYWQGGVCFGPRHLVPAIPLLALSVAYLPGSWMRSPVFLALAAAGIAINAIGTATTPFVSEYDTNPLSHSYRELVAAGALAINPVRFLTPSAEAAARWREPERFRGASFNLGQRLGLARWWSLLPLAVWWGCCLAWIRRSVVAGAYRQPGAAAGPR